MAGGLFLLAQLSIFGIWKTVQRRTRKERYLYQHEPTPTITYGAPTMLYGPPPPSSAASSSGASYGGSAKDTLSKLYDSGINGRYGQQF